MNLTKNHNVKIIAALLILAVITQAVYTALYVGASDEPRKWLWGVEGLVFVLMMAVAGATLVQNKQYSLGFSAIFASAILNLIQVGIGLTQFGPFYEVVDSVEAVAPAAGSVVALSFFIYNAAKVLLGIAAIVLGKAISQTGSKLLGQVTLLAGLAAVVANAIVMMFGRIELVPSGATGVIATLLLGLCLLKLNTDNTSS